MSKQPFFQYTLSSPNNRNYKYITLGDEKVHCIINVEEFYIALGYTEEIRKTGLMAEEFIWGEYRRDDSYKCQICIQVKIVAYLNSQSTKYKEKYATQFEYWYAKRIKKWTNNDVECENCVVPMRILNFSPI